MDSLLAGVPVVWRGRKTGQREEVRKVRGPGLYTSGKGTKTLGHSTLFSQATLEGRLSYDQLATNTIRGWGGGGIWAAHPITYHNSIPTMSQGQIQMLMIRWTKGTKKKSLVSWSLLTCLQMNATVSLSICMYIVLQHSPYFNSTSLNFKQLMGLDS